MNVSFKYTLKSYVSNCTTGMPKELLQAKRKWLIKNIVLNTIVYGFSWDLDMILDVKRHVSCYYHILTKLQVYKHWELTHSLYSV